MEALEHELADAKLAVESAQLVSSTLQASQKENDKLRSKLRVLIDANGKLKAQLNGAADSPAVRDLRAQLGAMSLESSAARATLLEVPPVLNAPLYLLSSYRLSRSPTHTVHGCDRQRPN